MASLAVFVERRRTGEFLTILSVHVFQRVHSQEMVVYQM